MDKQSPIYKLICWTVVVIAIFIIPSEGFAQCAMCNATASTATEGSSEKALALNNGILFLMAIPYILLSTLVIIWWQYSRQRHKEQQESSI